MHQQKSSRGKENKGKARMKKTVATEPQDDDHTTRGKQYDTPG